MKKASLSIYLMLAIAGYCALAFLLISSAGYSWEKIAQQTETQQFEGKLSAACTYLELLSAGSSNTAADYSLLQGVSFTQNKASIGNYSKECLVKAGSGKILRVE